jgi:5'-3' exonuclease, N-terminal resolvase-like domain
VINLLDGDLIAYRASASCEPTKAKPFLEPPEVAIWRLHDMIERICIATNSSDIECYIGGSDNFRYKIYPEYKANRTKEKPHYLEACRELLVTQYRATIVNLIETDDALGIAQTKYDGNSRIVSLDKDLLQCPGWHFNWVTGMHKLVSPLDGLRTFYKQLILGDRTDNIPGYDGKLRGECPKFIQKLQEPIDEMTEEIDMYEYVCDVYANYEIEQEMPGEAVTWEWHHDKLHRNAQLLYILKNEEEYWKPPNGPKEESMPSS